jgi:hypothetical protein
MAQSKLEQYDRLQLLAEITILKQKLDKKKLDHSKAKSKLKTYQLRVQKMKSTIDYQRSRILELHRGNVQEPGTNEKTQN